MSICSDNADPTPRTHTKKSIHRYIPIVIQRWTQCHYGTVCNGLVDKARAHSNSNRQLQTHPTSVDLENKTRQPVLTLRSRHRNHVSLLYQF